MPSDKELPNTLKKSSKKAQDTYRKTLESAEAEYGKGERASRTAYASLKHSFEKVEDHWEEKDAKGPSDEQSKQSTKDKREHPKETFGGVDVEGHTKQELAERAKKLGVRVTTKMTKVDLARAIDRKQQTKTAKAR